MIKNYMHFDILGPWRKRQKWREERIRENGWPVVGGQHLLAPGRAGHPNRDCSGQGAPGLKEPNQERLNQ